MSDMIRKLLLSVILLSLLLLLGEYIVLNGYEQTSRRGGKRNRTNEKKQLVNSHFLLSINSNDQAARFGQSAETASAIVARRQRITGSSGQYMATQSPSKRFDDVRKLKRGKLRKKVANFLEESNGKIKGNKSNQRRIQQTKVRSSGSRAEEKRVLIYTPLFGEVPWQGLRNTFDFTHFRGEPCPITKCLLTYRHRVFSHTDIVVFHGQDMPPVYELDELNARRPKGQIWVYVVLESPLNTRDTYFFNDMFNWTMTYEGNSDIYLPYGSFAVLQPGEKSPHPKINVSNKDRLAVWTVSNCGGMRDLIVRKLQNHIRVDVFGNCGEDFYQPEVEWESCERYTKECNNLLKRYKFQLALENGYCEDYVTEKYWGTPLNLGIVPVVLGGANYSKLAIPGSYINVLDFDSVKALADYLAYLDKNDTAYMEYFSWRRKFRVDGFLNTAAFNKHYPWTCRLCEKAQTPDNKSYPSLSEFRDPEKLCGVKEDKIFDMIDPEYASDRFASNRNWIYGADEGEDFGDHENHDENGNFDQGRQGNENNNEKHAINTTG